ncbi:hypothetical protein FOMPIDRAFT_1133631 [Fomitopsis schrenkii]|uniref:Oxidation resistance protein 1 n=1 Tax=Fomitopsis schrenkii TaxID=2126942 RepID=S8DUA6_FOMSC|nr:hypothetical protein FOMPIDRAFT_1133631 [Fomitopsis schrenkii]
MGSLDTAITHGTPFAAAPFVPATGAPGFAGDRRWDKGFSDDFEKTRVDKKSVRLVGRKEMTAPVLTVELADILRPHFPALARLPRAWTLLYSLDQHGISLNTLYRRCEAHTGGALVVLRDAGDAVFGVWMGQGIHLSKGAYYGSGESCVSSVLVPRARVVDGFVRDDADVQVLVAPDSARCSLLGIVQRLGKQGAGLRWVKPTGDTPCDPVYPY